MSRPKPVSSLPTPPKSAHALLSYSIRVQTFGLYLLFPLLFSLLIPLFRSLWKSPSSVGAVRLEGLFYLSESLLILLWCLFYLHYRHKREDEQRAMSLLAVSKELGFRASQPLKLIVRGAFAYPLILSPMVIMVALGNWIFQRYTTPAHPLSLSFMLLESRWDWALLFVQTAVMAPLVEETLFRGVLYPALRERWGVWGGIALSSAIFAILHPNMPAGFLPLFVLGAGMAILYERNRSLLPAMVLHAINNGFILVIQYLTLNR